MVYVKGKEGGGLPHYILGRHTCIVAQKVLLIILRSRARL
jgi:hypothetical protein